MDISEAIRAELIKRRVDREIERRLEIIETYGDDREDGAVIKFEKRMPVGRQTWLAGQVLNAQDFNLAFAKAQAAAKSDGDGMRTYTYAGVRVGGRWYLTGATEVENARTWDDLVMWMAGYCDPVLEIIDMYPAQPVAAGPRVDPLNLGQKWYQDELDRQAKGNAPDLPDDVG